MRTSRSGSFRKAGRNPISEHLSGLTIGALTLSPTFDEDVFEYTATTTNATNKVTATPKSASVDMTIELNGEEIENGSSAEWEDGENTLTISLIGDSLPTVYTVIVTKTEEGD